MPNKNLEGSIVKKANTQEVYTEEQITELAKCMDPEKGYINFAKNFSYIQHPTKGKIKFAPHPYQKKLLKSFHDYRQTVCLLPRQVGKCVSENSTIRVKHKITGEVREISIGDFYKMQQKSN